MNKPSPQWPEATERYIAEMGLSALISFDPTKPVRDVNDAVDPTNTTPVPPDWNDLSFLHQTILARKVTTILEFGVGHSTLVMADALRRNKEAHGAFVSRSLRRNNPFELHSVDDVSEYIGHTRGRVPQGLHPFITFHESAARMGTFGDRICTYYDELPNICPDFIYLDAPNQGSPKGAVRNIHTRHPDRLPMGADLLALEHFLLPGTMIVVDGRTANARFLKCNFQRRWTYLHDVGRDVHVFELTETPLGPYNRAQIEYCLGPEWLARFAA